VVEEGARLAREAESQVVVAVGGGSVMDAGRLCILLANESPIDQYDGINMVKIATPPLVAIPTTASSASG
jgi:alcohol dehydrogenase class IV